MIYYKPFSEFCQLANRLILNYYGQRASCIYSTAVVCDVLTRYGLKSEPLRVTAGVFSRNDTPQHQRRGCVLGSDGCGQRMPAAKPDCWNGHLVSVVENDYLIDTTLDQVMTFTRTLERRHS